MMGIFNNIFMDMIDSVCTGFFNVFICISRHGSRSGHKAQQWRIWSQVDHRAENSYIADTNLTFRTYEIRRFKTGTWIYKVDTVKVIKPGQIFLIKIFHPNDS